MIYEKAEQKPQIWFSLGHFVNDIYTGFLNPIMPFIAEQVKISMPIAAIILSCSHIFSSLLQPIFGYFADRMKKRMFIFWGLIFTATFIPLAACSKNLTSMILFIIFGSIGSSLFHPQVLGLVSKFTTSDIIKNMGIFMACGTVGYSLGPLLSATFAQYIGLNKMPYLSILGIFWALAMFKFVPKFSNTGIPAPKFKLSLAMKDILTNKKLNILNLIAMLKSLIITSCSILLPFLWKTMGYSKFQIGLALFLFLLFGGIASFVSPKAEKYIGIKNVFYISMIATFPLMLLFMLTYKTFPILSFIVFILTGFITMFASPVTMSLAQSVLPQYKSIIGGFINGFSWGIVAVIMSIVGFVAQAVSIVPVLVILSAIPVVCSFLVEKLFQLEN